MKTIIRVATALALLGIPLIVMAAPPVKTIKFAVRDADTNVSLSADIEVDNTKVDNGLFTLPSDPDSRIAVNVSANAGSGYYPRIMTVYLEGFKKDNVPFNIHLAQIQSDYIYTRGIVKQASEYINQDSADRAVALLERINKEVQPGLKESQFGVYLTYNLARAYLANCQYRFVDQCKDAKSNFDSLLPRFESNKKWMDAESISQDNISNINIEEFYNRMTYLQAKWDIARGRYAAAKEALQQLLNDDEKKPGLLSTINRTRSGLDEDIRYIDSKSATTATQ